MRKKSVLEYLLIGLFVAFMFGALFASVSDAIATAELKYFQFGKVLLIAFLGLMSVFVCTKVIHQVSLKWKKTTKLTIWLGACVMVMLCGVLLRIYVIQVYAADLSNEGNIYYEIAKHLVDDTLLSAQGEYYRQYAARSPQLLGYPLFFLAPVFKIFGANTQIALYFNVICSIATTLVALHIGYTAGGKVGAFISSMFVSLWPSYVLSANILSAEPLFTLLLAIVLDIFLLVLDRSPRSVYLNRPVVILPLLLIGGVILALAMSIRSVAIILLIAFSIVQLTMGSFGRENIPNNSYRVVVDKGWLCVLSVTCALLLTNYGINSLKQDMLLEKVPGMIHSHGYQMMMGMNVEENGQWNQHDEELYQSFYAETMSVVDAQEASIQEAMGRIRCEPHQILNLMANKFFTLWQSDNYPIERKLWAEDVPTNNEKALLTLETVYPYTHIIYVIILMTVMLLALNTWRKPGIIEPSQYMMMLFLMGSTLVCIMLDAKEYYHFSSMLIMLMMSSNAVIQWRGYVAEEVPVKVVVKEGKFANTLVDHTHFDMHTALREGHVHMSVSEAVAERSVQHSLVSVAMADDAEDEVTANAEEAAESAAPDIEEDAEAVTEEAPVEESVEETADDAEAVTDEPEEVTEEAVESAETEATVEEVAEEAPAEVEENCDAVEEEEVSSEIADTEEPAEAAPESEAETATEDEAEEVAETDVVLAAAEDDTAPEDAEEVPAEIASEADDVIDEVAVMMAEESCEAAAEEPMEESEEAAVEAVAAGVETEAPTEEETEEEAPVEPEAVAEEAPAVAEPNEEPEPEVQLEEAMAEPELAAVNAPATDLSADVDVLPMVYVKPVKKQAAAVQGKTRAAAKPVAKKTTASTALKTPRAPAKRQKLSQQDRMQRTVERRKAVARRKQRRQRQAARR